MSNPTDRGHENLVDGIISQQPWFIIDVAIGKPTGRIHKPKDVHILRIRLTNHQSRTGLTAPVFLCSNPLRGVGAGRGSRVAAQGQRWVTMILRLTCRHTSRSVQMGGGAYAHLDNPFTYIEIYVLNEPLKANSLQPIRRSRSVNVLGAYTHRLLLYPCN